MTRRSCVPALLVLLIAGCGDGPVGPALRAPIADVPGDLTAVTFAADGTASVPYFMLELRASSGFRGFVAVNDAGMPVWFFRTVGGPFGFTRRANGNFVFLDSERGLVEVTPAGAEVRELPQAARPGRRMHHDLTASPWGTVLFIAEEWREFGGSMVNGEAVWEWTPETEAVTRRWSSFDHLDPVLDRGPRTIPTDWLHANSISVGARGNVLLSLHFLDQVISIAPDFRAIEWRMGGVRAGIAVREPFSGQHTAQELRGGTILLFDNGYDRTATPYSRAVEFALAADSARPVWQWRPERDNWARVISSARRLSNGNTVVGFGTPADMPAGATGPIEVYEVTGTGQVRWHLEIGGAAISMYRATPLERF